MRKMIFFPVVVLALLMSAAACSSSGPEGTAGRPSSTEPEVTRPAETPESPAATAEFPEPTVVIRLSQGRFGNPLHVVVLEGEYRLSSRDIANAGSSIDVTEDLLTFPKWLGIDIVQDVTLRGVKYSKGTKLIVNEEGDLVPR
jgi:hypothetical protein